MVMADVLFLKVSGYKVKNNLSQAIQLRELFHVVEKDFDFFFEDDFDLRHPHPRVA